MKKLFVVFTAFWMLASICANAQDVNKSLVRERTAIGDDNSTITRGDDGDNMIIKNVWVQGTEDNVLGSLTRPGFTSFCLATCVGKNLSGLQTFPTDGGTYKVNPNGYLTNSVGNAGKLHFSLDADNLDLTKCKFELVNSLGEVFPVELSDIAFVEGGFEFNGTIYSEGFEAKVTLGLDGIDKLYSDYTNNIWDANTGQDDDSNILNSFTQLAQQLKTGTVTRICRGSNKILEDFYYTNIQREIAQKLSLRVTSEDGNQYVTSADIMCVAFIPLNYKQILQLENVDLAWRFTDYDSTVGGIAKAIRSIIPNISYVSFKSVSLVNETPTLNIEANGSEMSVEVSEEVLDAVNNGMDLSTLESVVNIVLTPYNSIETYPNNLINRVNTYLDHISDRYTAQRGGNIAWNAVEPILIFNNQLGISQLWPEMIINGDLKTTFIMTSLTDESIVPTYMKYIAVAQNGTVLESHLYEGYEKVAQLSLPLGESEIIYQVSDFYGNVVTKRYPVYRTEKATMEKISISDAKHVPYYSANNLDFSDMPNLKAYVATGYDKATGTIWLTRVKQVPANTGFLLMGEPGNYQISISESASNVYYKNMFKGTLDGTTLYTTDGDYTNYYLSKGESGVGFYKVTKAEGQSIGANRCYLPILTNIPTNGSEGDAELIKVSAAKQVPYYTSKNLDFTSMEAQGVKAYTATGYNYGTGIIWLTRVKKVPAHTGVLIMTDGEGDYSIPTASVASIYENMFVGSEDSKTIFTNETIDGVDYVNYYLSNGTSGVGFYKVTQANGVSMDANRCYLPIPYRASSGTRGDNSEMEAFCQMIISDEASDNVISIPVFGGVDDDNDDPTGIEVQSSIFNVQSNDVYYNLQGQRVDNPTKGLDIRNGKKVVIK